MTPLQIAAFRAHASSATYARRLAELHGIVARIDPAASYVSFSAGKDSAVVAHACAARHPGIAILMVDPGCPTHWTEAERDAWLSAARALGWRLTLYPWDKWSGAQAGDDEQQYRDRVHRSMFADIHARAQRDGLRTRVMGLRAEESPARRMLIGSRGREYTYADGTAAVLPIATWRTTDVWAYIVTAGLPWLSIYDALGPQARNGLIGRNGERFGRAEYLREHFPDAWRWARSRGIFGDPTNGT